MANLDGDRGPWHGRQPRAVNPARGAAPSDGPGGSTMIEVTCRYERGSPVLVVSGPVRDADVPVFRTVLDGTLEGDHRSVTVDLRGAEIDSPELLRHCT